VLKQLLALASVAETATGLGLMADPRLIVSLLLGAEVSGVGVPVARCFGVALFALGLACWPTEPNAQTGSPAFRAMLVYNAAIALFLAYLFVAGHFGGILLWPAVALHAAVALLLLWTWQTVNRRRS